jgi:quercetin dioxygenase-like cupin family protein
MHAQTTSSAQIADPDAFRRDGYLGPTRLLTQAQCDLIVRYLQVGVQPTPLDWPKGRAAVDRLLYDLATRPRLLALLRPLLGNDIVLWGVDVVERDPGQIHPWHTDIESSAPGRRFVSAWIGIRDTSQESALQFITRSHHLGKPVQQVLQERGLRRGGASDQAILAFARECDPLAAFVQPEMADGDAILYDGGLWHATNNKRSEGRRIALLLQYAAADAPVSIPDFSRPGWPFRFLATRPPAVVVSGRGDGSVNRLVPPPPACPESTRVLSSFVQPVELPWAEDPKKQWRSDSFFRASSPVLQYIASHISVLSSGHSPHPIHTHAAEEIRVVLSGEAEVLLSNDLSEDNASRESLPAGTFSFCPAFQPHAIRNPHDVPVTYLVLYWRAAPLETNPRYAMDIIRFDRASATAKPEPFERQVVLERPTSYLTKLHAHVSTLQPGTGYDPHVDDYDVAIVLLAGKVETLERIVEPHSLIYYVAGEPHGMKNVGDEPARYLVFEFHAPRRSFRSRVPFQIPSTERAGKPPVQQFRTFWVGPPLSAYEELSLKSLLARGHRVLLYSYDKTLRVPDGVELADANEILPSDQIHEFVHPNGETSPTPHANLFRYEALRRYGGWYCDLDVLLVGQYPPLADVYLAREDERTVNNAVMRFPPGAPLMVAAAEAARGLVSSSQWGASGPRLLTRLVEELGLSQAVQPPAAAYPIAPADVHQLFLPKYREELEDRVAGADFVHLWNQIWRRVRIPKDLGPPEGSFLDSLFRTFGIRVSPCSRMSERAVASWFSDFHAVEAAKRIPGGLSNVVELAQACENASRNDGRPISALATTLHELRWQRDQMLQSTSWRVTAPMRDCIDALRRITRRRGQDS